MLNDDLRRASHLRLALVNRPDPDTGPVFANLMNTLDQFGFRFSMSIHPTDLSGRQSNFLTGAARPHVKSLMPWDFPILRRDLEKRHIRDIPRFMAKSTDICRVSRK